MSKELTEDINNCRENHPELVVRDLENLVPPELIRHILKFRGINKWLRVRRLLIQLKHRWKDEIKALEEEKKEAKLKGDIKAFHKLQGYQEALIDCRQQIRALTHSPRDINFPTDVHNWGPLCSLPQDFPKRPHKRWFLTH